MRVYIPATIPMLRDLVATGELKPVSGTAFAVTPAFRESYAAGNTEELEYAAMAEAARASLRLIAPDATDPDAEEAAASRRVVVSADVDDVTLRPDLDHGAVRIAGTVPNSVIAAVHVDLPDAAGAVRAAAAVVDAADMGDPDAEFVLGDADDYDLAWYAAQEVPFLLELL